MKEPETKVLAISSGGGHWVQLLRVLPAFEGYDMTFATVSDSYREDVPNSRFLTISDATRWNKVALMRVALQVLWILVRLRPDVVISTGAAPGYFGVRFGKLLGARTIWLDSMANVDDLSMSGRQIRPWADLWLTQWPHLASSDGPYFLGNVL